MATLEFNYKDSLSLILKSELNSLGYDMSPLNDFKDVLKAYYTVRFRLVEKRPRMVHKACSFQCPLALMKGLSFLEQKFIRGDNINPHLSKELRNLNYVDGMMFDWGIHHFHLGETLDNRGLIERTGDVLYAMVKQNDVYFIMIAPHGNWVCKDLLEIVNTEWPSIFDDCRLAKGNSLVFIPSELDIKTARKSHINMNVELSDGTVLVSPGMGMMTDGTSAMVMHQIIRFCNELKKEGEYMRASLERICDTIDPRHRLDRGNMHFHFCCKREGNQIVIEDSMYQIRWYRVMTIEPLKQLFQ